MNLEHFFKIKFEILMKYGNDGIMLLQSGNVKFSLNDVSRLLYEKQLKKRNGVAPAHD